MKYAPTKTTTMIPAKTPMAMLRSCSVKVLPPTPALVFGGGGAGSGGPITTTVVGANVKGGTEDVVDEVDVDDDVDLHAP